MSVDLAKPAVQFWPAAPRTEENAWQPLMLALRDDTPVLLLFGDSIPGTPDVRVGLLIAGDVAEELGYPEYAQYGGWLIWNSGSDFYVEDFAAPINWAPLPGAAPDAANLSPPRV